LAEVYGGLVNLDLLIDENLELATIPAVSETIVSENPTSAAADQLSNIKNEEPNNLLNNLLQTFGGEVIS